MAFKKWEIDSYNNFKKYITKTNTNISDKNKGTQVLIKKYKKVQENRLKKIGKDSHVT